MNRLKQLRDVAICAITLLALWQIVVWITGVPRYILPGPVQVLSALVDNFDLVMQHFRITAIEVLTGIVLGVSLGISTAISLMLSTPLRRVTMPMLVLSQVIPVFALAPLLTLWLGYGLASKIAMTLLIIYFPVTSSLLDGLSNTSPGYLDLARTMGASRKEVLLQIRLPAALPSLASGLRLAAVYAPIGAVIGEWVGASSGLGYLMLLANGRVKIDLMFAALFALCVFAILLRAAMGWLADRVESWSTGTTV